MGTGWVRETLDHDYTDAQRRGHPVALLVTETTGALPHLRPTFVSRRPSFSRTRARDRQYILYIAAPAMSFNLTMGMSPF